MSSSSDAVPAAEGTTDVPKVAENPSVTTVESVEGKVSPVASQISPAASLKSEDSKNSADKQTPAETTTANTPPATPAVPPVDKEENTTKEEPVKEQSPVIAEPKQPEETPKKKQATTSTSSKKRIPYKYDPDKVTLRFLFANRDGLSVTIDCEPADTVGEVKGALLSVWPEELPNCGGGDRLRLICMGKGLLMPDTRTLEECQVPTFKTHATPVNVSVRPDVATIESLKTENQRSSSSPRRSRQDRNSAHPSGTTNTVETGCSCVIS